MRHLFRGHEIVPGFRFTLSAGPLPRSVDIEVMETSSNPKTFADVADNGGIPIPGLALDVTGHREQTVSRIPLTSTGGLSDAFEPARRPARWLRDRRIFVASRALTINELVGFWNDVTLKPAELFVLKALQYIDPNLERIAVQAATANSYDCSGSRGGFIVILRGSERPVPIGSLGDGVWRMLLMAIAITSALEACYWLMKSTRGCTTR